MVMIPYQMFQFLLGNEHNFLDVDMAIYAAMLAGKESKARAYHTDMMKHLPVAMVREEEWPEVFQVSPLEGDI